MIITQPNLQFFFTATETRFWTAYGVTPRALDKLATTYPVGTEQWVSGWIGMLDRARKWLGSRVAHQPAPQTYLVRIDPYELTEEIDEFRLKDDTYGIYNPTITMMGENMKKEPDYSLRDLIQNQGDQTGVLQNGIDGLAHWNTAHPVDFYDASKGTYCNDFTGGGFTVNGVNVGGALALNSFSTLWEEMSERKSESGEKLGLVPDLTTTGSRLKLTIDTILQAQFLGAPVVGNLGAGSSPNSAMIGSSENVLKGWTDRLCWADLGGSSTYDQIWYQLVTNKPVKPFSWLQREAPNFVYRIDPKDPNVFDKHSYLYGSMARWNPAWGFAWLSARSGP